MPATWAPLEPAKFLASDQQSIFKFEGFGHYGEAIGARARLLGYERLCSTLFRQPARLW